MTEQDQSYKRSWLAIGIGTIVLMVSYGSLLTATATTASETPEAAGPLFALGFALVPLVYVAVAFLSGRSNAPMAVLKGMGVWMLVALPLGLLHPVFGYCAGFGMGGVLTLKERDTDRWQTRSIAVFIAATYSLGMLFVYAPIGVLSGGLLSLASLGLADAYTEYRAKRVDDSV